VNDTLPLPNQVVALRYRVVRELGRGGMGVVYVVEHVRTGDVLALKLLHGRSARDPLARERFKREAQAAARIRSEHVVRVVDADVAPELEGAPFLVMELLDGLDLEKLLAGRGRFSAEEVVGHLSQAARALDKSHAMGIVHRDLKPENLFLHRREDGTFILKIVDFGISKIVGAEAGGELDGAGMTTTGAVMGTPLYMAPEQARGLTAHISAATDVWAMGLIAVRLLTGQVYWNATAIAELLLQIVSDPLYAPTQRWPSLPPAFDAWFAKACSRDPAQRFRSVGEQIDALAAALGVSVPASGARAPAPAPQSGALSPTGPGATTTNHPLTRSETSPAFASPTRAPLLLAALAILGFAGSAWLLRGHRVMPEMSSTTPTAASRPLPSAWAGPLVPPVTRPTEPTVDAGAPPTAVETATAPQIRPPPVGMPQPGVRTHFAPTSP
jgi:serine/threonine protein kinase